MRSPKQRTSASVSAASARRPGAALTLALVVCVLSGAMRRGGAAPGASPTSGSARGAAAQPSPLAKPRPAASPQPDERAALLNFLGETIAWYRQIATEERLAVEPAETLFLSDDRQMALEVVQLAFQYARAHAALLKAEKHPETSASIQANGAAAGKSNA